MSARPPALLRALYRLPLHLRRFGIHGYERLLGIDWIVLTTRGRRSGRPRAVVLDVVGRDQASGGWYVQPASPDAAWVRNVRVHPRVTIEADGRRLEALAIEVTGDEGAEVVLRFVRDHPRYARLVAWLAGDTPTIDAGDAALRGRFRGVVVFALRPAAPP